LAARATQSAKYSAHETTARVPASWLCPRRHLRPHIRADPPGLRLFGGPGGSLVAALRLPRALPVARSLCLVPALWGRSLTGAACPSGSAWSSFRVCPAAGLRSSAAACRVVVIRVGHRDAGSHFVRPFGPLAAGSPRGGFAFPHARHLHRLLRCVGLGLRLCSFVARQARCASALSCTARTGRFPPGGRSAKQISNTNWRGPVPIARLQLEENWSLQNVPRRGRGPVPFARRASFQNVPRRGRGPVPFARRAGFARDRAADRPIAGVWADARTDGETIALRAEHRAARRSAGRRRTTGHTTRRAGRTTQRSQQP